ncbi:Acetyl esterase/lipase [Formosa sp. Hel1_31_208]|uniref:ankyrin repeat domain-containing protein n=1 Tax=Formosa sp. Hel1_31_208 TaxID=1798225 RepID=UPI00087D56F5|nr:ankyrin repeat domain-containing protein [Formosa sp. Hel1_31_208]SDS39497.1 Acetyl esterase/lipase [Formosa sp. Hel1_31_208]
MKNIKPLLILCLVLTTNYVSGQLCDQDKRFTAFEYFSDTQIDSLKNITYGNAIDYSGKSQDLKMDLFFPNNKIDPIEKRPFILLIHGGGFHGGSRESMIYHSNEFAKRGFVVATMSYRLGFDPNVRGDIQKAVYRAQQDANTALRYIDSQAERLKIDRSWIFIGGSSAGAVTSLFTSYASQSEWNMVLPQFESTLGSLESSVTNKDQTLTIKGIYNFMGAVQPIVFNSGELIPTISFHGDLDKTVPIGKSQTGFGSKPIHEMLTEAGVCNDLTIVLGGGHGIYRSKDGQDYRINRVASFFKSLFCDTCTSSISSEEDATSKTDISLKLLNAIKDGNIQKIEELIDIESLDKCHEINGGLYNYLAVSIKSESIESLKYFVSKKADLEGNCSGKTPLMYAVKYGQLDAVKHLLKNGADLNATNKKSALQYAVKYNHTEIKKYIEQYKSD